MTTVYLELPQVPARVVERYARDKEIGIDEAQIHFSELVKFMKVCAAFPGDNVPSRILDEVWHAFVLYTKDYRDFCDRHLGQFIHHQPTGRPMAELYHLTRSRIKAMFGDLDLTLWPQNAGGEAICNDCCDDNPGGEDNAG